jgi:leucyl/phenylalanyl-tRNA--protein transferase
MYPLTPELLLSAYAQGAFPMGRTRDDPDLVWLSPRMRGVIPLDGLKVSRSLRKTLRKGVFQVAADRDFPAVIAACADPAPGREDTWITPAIVDLYGRLFEMGFVHSVECRSAEGELVGGLYGVAMGAAFFGESMFSRRDDASKVALVHLVARLRAGGYALLDTQFTTPHLERLGAVEIPRPAYLTALHRAIRQVALFDPPQALIDAELTALTG